MTTSLIHYIYSIAIDYKCCKMTEGPEAWPFIRCFRLAKLQICPEQDLTLEQVHHAVQQAMRQEASPEGGR